jgi:hypothetical protein
MMLVTHLQVQCELVAQAAIGGLFFAGHCGNGRPLQFGIVRSDRVVTIGTPIDDAQPSRASHARKRSAA